LKLVLTINTDLSDSFLSPKEPIQLSILVASSQYKDGATFLDVTPKKAPRWRAGLRVLKIDLPWPPGLAGVLQIRPSDPRLTASSASDVVGSNQGLIAPIYVELPIPGKETPHVCSRRLKLSETSQIEIQEDLGESMARHVWDGAMVTVSMLASLHSETAAAASDRASLSWIKDIFTGNDALCILEIGCGVGVLGIGITTLLQSASGDTAAGVHVLMTDLPDAEACASANISRHATSDRSTTGRTVDLQYENLDWDDAKLGKFGPMVRSRPWNLVALSDCTYNVDSLPALVQTLSEAHAASACHPDRPEGAWETQVLLATKPRHPSEVAFLDLLSSNGWAIRQKAVLPLPILETEEQSVEIYLFYKK
jgi:hypothetical protein